MILVSGHNPKLIFQQFNKWLDANNILAGFNLTESLLLELFAFLDPHKKGYLTLQDWCTLFRSYDTC